VGWTEANGGDSGPDMRQIKGCRGVRSRAARRLESAATQRAVDPVVMHRKSVWALVWGLGY
jgi:hypothetical protein